MSAATWVLVGVRLMSNFRGVVIAQIGLAVRWLTGTARIEERCDDKIAARAWIRRHGELMGPLTHINSSDTFEFAGAGLWR